MIGNLLRLWLMQMCECCWDDCDCGCIEDCPLHHPSEGESDRG